MGVELGNEEKLSVNSITHALTSKGLCLMKTEDYELPANGVDKEFKIYPQFSGKDASVHFLSDGKPFVTTPCYATFKRTDDDSNLIHLNEAFGKLDFDRKYAVLKGLYDLNRLFLGNRPVITLDEHLTPKQNLRILTTHLRHFLHKHI